MFYPLGMAVSQAACALFLLPKCTASPHCVREVCYASRRPPLRLHVDSRERLAAVQYHHYRSRADPARG